MKVKIIVLACITLLYGCANVPDISENHKLLVKSEIGDKSIYDLLENNFTIIEQDNWWLKFNDNQLNTLISNILKNNQDLTIASLNIEKTQELINTQKSSSDLQVESTGFVQKQKLSEGGFYPAPLGGSVINFTQLSVKSSLDLDLFNKTNYLINEQEYKVEGLKLNKKIIELNLSIQAVKIYSYWQYLSIQENIINKQLILNNKLLDLLKFKFNSGLVTETEILTAKNNINLLKIEKSKIDFNKEFSINGLSKLLGNLNEKLELKESNFLNAIDDVAPPKLINSNVIENKPEVAYYLMNIKAQKEKIKSLRSDFYPSVSLTGEVGFQKIGINDVFKIGNMFANLGPAIHLPILDGKRIATNYKIGGLDLNIFIEKYNQVVINSYYNLNEQLQKTKQSFSTLIMQNNSYKNDEKKLSLVNIKYDLGKLSLYEKIQQENDYLNSKKQISQTRIDYFNNQIDLINNMGGIIK